MSAPSEREQRELARLIPDEAGTVTFVDEAIIVAWPDGTSSRITEQVLSWGPNGEVSRQRRTITIAATPWESVTPDLGSTGGQL